MKDKNMKIKQISKYIVFLLIGIMVGTGITFLLMDFGTNKIGKVKTSTIKKDKFAPLYEAYETLKENYYVDLDDDILVNGMIDGMMKATGDDHTMFFDKEAKDTFELSLSSSYYGIGAQITKVEEDTVITKIFDDSPASKSDLKVGDIFVSVDGELTKGLEPSEISFKLRSDKSRIATIVINRDGEELTFEIEKSNVELPSISSEMMDDNIGYIYVSIFGENTSYEFANALSKLDSQGMEKLIIDLRDNSGGYLSTVTSMVSMFTDKSNTIYQIKERDKITKYNSLTNSKLNLPVVVLVNEESASASEIMASCLKEQYDAILVGTTTYGKGTVQQTKELSNDTLIKYTIEEWLTSKGNSINKKGITPDVEIELSEEYNNNPIDENDNQLQKALELLK